MSTYPAPVTRLVARSPEDIIAFVPLAIGFAPETSVVMLTLGPSTGTFHARVDLPEDPGDVDDVVESLLRPARRHRVSAVVFVVYDDDTAVADEAAWSLSEAFTDAGIEVLDVLRVHDHHWFAVRPGHPRSAYAGVPFDPGTHPFTAQAVFDGRVTHASRTALQASLDTDPAAAAVTAEALAQAQPLDAAGARSLVQKHTRSRTTCSPAELAALGLAVAEGSLRATALEDLVRSRAQAHVDFWSDAVRRLPDHLLPGAASVLALAAWLHGNGALAWCAVDRCRRIAPHHPLAELVADLLEHAVSPRLWEKVRSTAGVAIDGAA